MGWSTIHSMPTTKEYRDNYEKVFGPKKQPQGDSQESEDKESDQGSQGPQHQE